MYKQCPRKYYYRYIAKLPTSSSIHLVRGSIAHKVMEDIYDVSLDHIPDAAFLPSLRVILQEKFRTEWEKSKGELEKLGLSEIELYNYYDETKDMINNFYHWLLERMKVIDALDLKAAFKLAKPQREVELRSDTHGVRGYADAIHREGDKIVIIDYKTSKKAEITDDYHLQLSIYGMIYEEKERIPDEVGIFFLKFGVEKRLPVTRSMVERAKVEIADVRARTKSLDIRDYPKNVTPLCKWSSGQCDFYDTCFGKGLSDYDGVEPDDLVQLGRRGL
jgi:putative RecB family exonuclease